MLTRARFGVFVPGDITPLGIGASVNAFTEALSNVSSLALKPFAAWTIFVIERVGEVAFTDLIHLLYWG